MRVLAKSLAVLCAVQISGNAYSQNTSPTPPCATERHADFDFWVGEWDVYITGAETNTDGSPQIIARSSIEKLYNDCAIRENWNPVRPSPGGSLSAFNPETGKWEQTWIGSAAGIVYFEGGKVEDGMVLTGTWYNLGGPDKDGLIRMTFTPNAKDGSVRQFGQASYDHGVSWQVSFDFTYRPRKVAEKDPTP